MTTRTKRRGPPFAGSRTSITRSRREGSEGVVAEGACDGATKLVDSQRRSPVGSRCCRASRKYCMNWCRSMAVPCSLRPRSSGAAVRRRCSSRRSTRSSARKIFPRKRDQPKPLFSPVVNQARTSSAPGNPRTICLTCVYSTPVGRRPMTGGSRVGDELAATALGESLMDPFLLVRLTCL
jgi:hypothetical protein